MAKLNKAKGQLADLEEELDELQYMHTTPPQPPLPGLATNETPIIHPNPSFVGHNTPATTNTYTTIDKELSTIPRLVNCSVSHNLRDSHIAKI